jgi:hypothetical protein
VPRLAVATARTLEQKISDAGPNDQRIDPHVLTGARKQLVADGVITKTIHAGVPWYHLTVTPPKTVKARLDVLRPIHLRLQQQSFTNRLGQTLEIAVYRALRANPEIHTLGAFPDLDAHDDSTLYHREEPPSTISGKTTPGKLDFIVVAKPWALAGVEVKNVREWLYPDRDEVRDLLTKCCALDAVPVLIGRRIPFVTFKLLNICGVVVHQTYNQLFPLSEEDLAEQARHKDLLGYHDIRLGNQPDARLQRFCSEHLPPLIHSMLPRFNAYRDLLQAFSSGAMPYEEFAARTRRRSQAKAEDSDWHSYE